MQVLYSLAKLKKGQIQAPLTAENRNNRKEWAKKYLKQDWGEVIFTDECRVSCDVPTVVRNGWKLTVFNRRQQKGGSIMFWLGIHNDAIIGPFKIEGNLDSKSYCNLLENNFLPCIKA